MCETTVTSEQQQQRQRELDFNLQSRYQRKESNCILYLERRAERRFVRFSSVLSVRQELSLIYSWCKHLYEPLRCTGAHLTRSRKKELYCMTIERPETEEGNKRAERERRMQVTVTLQLHGALIIGRMQLTLTYTVCLLYAISLRLCHIGPEKWRGAKRWERKKLDG